MEVVILAGGSGSRFGGVKQFVPVAPDGATLLEVTLRDAARAGCAHAAIVTAPGMESQVRDLFAARPVAGCRITVVTQDPDDLPVKVDFKRDRPWGTAHALWVARKVVTGSFLLFNADDYYGPSAPATLASALGDEGADSGFTMLGFPLGTTLSEAGTVSRAVCETDSHGHLVSLREYPTIDREGRTGSRDGQGELLPLDALVSMNAWGLTPAIFPLLETTLTNFQNNFLNHFLNHGDLAHEECFFPAAVDAGVREGAITVRVVPAVDRWCGMTYREDRRRVVGMLKERAALEEVAIRFGLEVPLSAPSPFGAGLVHATWFVETEQGPRLLQRLNEEVFPDPAAMAENAAAAATRLDDALTAMGDDDPRHRLTYLPGQEGRPVLRASEGHVWRCLVCIPGARPADPANPLEIRSAARALGRFPGLVSRGRGSELKEILPGFHDTPARLQTCREAATTDVRSRLSTCRPEYERLMALAELAERLADRDLPLRPVHNDAKLDNVLVDAASGEALCVIDLDTAMPGWVPHDFGDLVRSAVTGGSEDETDICRITLRMEVFRDLAEGYLEGAGEGLIEAERDSLVDGALVITYEQALRFLTDYLDGDVYYRTEDSNHNLRRARAQICLLEKLLEAEADLRQIIVTS